MSDFPTKTPGRETMLARAVNAMVRAMGGGPVKLRIPTPTGGLDRELGLTSQLAEEVEIGPVVIRELNRKDGRAQVQVLIAANSLRSLMDARGAVSGLAILKSVETLVYCERVFRVTGVSAETFAGMEYLWRLEGLE